MKYVNQSSFRKNLEVVKEKFNQALKENKEYKINLWNIILIDLFLTLTYFLFYKIYGNLILEILDWEFYDFMILFFLTLTLSKIKHFFSLKFLLIDLLTGNFNSYLTKPVNTFIFQNLKSLKGAGIVAFVFGIFISFYFLLNMENLLLVFSLFLFAFLFEWVLNNFLWSFSFFMKNSFLWELFFFTQNEAERMTPKVFDKFYFNFFMIFPTIVGSFWIIEISKGRFYPLDYLHYVFILFLIFIVGTIFNWKYGLKRYEAFG